MPEYCLADGTCPADAKEPAGTACGDTSDTVCDDPDTCDAAGVCQPNNAATTVLCRSDTGDCDVPEYCLADGTCPATPRNLPELPVVTLRTRSVTTQIPVTLQVFVSRTTRLRQYYAVQMPVNVMCRNTVSLTEPVRLT